MAALAGQGGGAGAVGAAARRCSRVATIQASVGARRPVSTSMRAMASACAQWPAASAARSGIRSSRSASLQCETIRSRCHSALPGWGGELVADILACGEGLEGALEVALGLPHVAEPVPADGEVALPLALPGSASASLADVSLFAVKAWSAFGEVALRRQDIAGLFRLTETRTAPALPGSAAARRSAMFLLSVKAWRAAGRSPWADRRRRADPA